MKSHIKSDISESPEFLAWLEKHKIMPEFNMHNTSYRRHQMTEKNKKFFAALFITLVLALNIFLLVSFFLYFK